MPYQTYGVTSAATVPPMATAVSKPKASSSAYGRAPEPMPRRYEDVYHRPAAGVYMTGIPGYAAAEPGYTTPVSDFTSLSGLRGPGSLGGMSRGSGRISNRSLLWSEIKEALRGATSEFVGDLTQEIRATPEPLIPPQVSPTIVGVSPHRVQANHLVDKHPRKPEQPTNAISCCDTEKPFHTKNGPAPLQPRGEFHESRAGPVGADSPEGNG